MSWNAFTLRPWAPMMKSSMPTMRTLSPALAGTVANECVDSPHRYAITPCSGVRRCANGMIVPRRVMKANTIPSTSSRLAVLIVSAQIDSIFRPRLTLSSRRSSTPRPFSPRRSSRKSIVPLASTMTFSSRAVLWLSALNIASCRPTFTSVLT